MQSRFGLKDFVLMVLVIAVGASVWLAIVQDDRRFVRAAAVEEKAKDLERQLAILKSDFEQQLTGVQERLDGGKAELRAQLTGIQERLDRGVVVAGAGPGGPAGGPAAAASERDVSWAQPGIAIQWQPPWTFTSPPDKKPGFQVGGTFTEIFDARPAKVTPYIQTDVYGRRAVDLVMQPLAAYDPRTLKLRGVLAEAWQVDPDGMWLRVKIHDRARFSDGSPVTAEDLRWTFHDYIMNPEIEAQRDRSTLSDSIKSVEVVADRAVEFRFTQRLCFNLDNALTLWPLPKAFYSRIPASEINKSSGLLMGSGPFKMEALGVENQWTPDRTLVLVRNEQYWGGRVPLDAVRFLPISDEQPRLVAYTNKEGDMTTPASTQFVTKQKDPEWVKNNQNLNWVNMRSGNSFIAWNCGERNGKLTPFHDRRVRLAMTHLIDRERMIRDIWRGIGVVSKGSFLPSSPGSNPDTRPWPYDLARAKELLKEAGWEDRDGNGIIEDKDGHEFVFEFVYSSGGEIYERIALFLQDSCKAGGIRAVPKGIDWSVSDPVRKKRDFDAILLAWGANAPESDPKQIYHSNSIKDQGDNFAQWNNPEADRLIDAGRRELDPEKRYKTWHEFERVMHEDQPYTWIRVSPYLRFVQPEIGNVNTYPKGLEPWEFFRGSGPVAAPLN